MIGKLTIPRNGVEVELIVGDDMSVQCADERLKKTMEVELRAYKSNYSPALGPFGIGLLNQFARLYKGKVEFPERKPHPPGTVY